MKQHFEINLETETKYPLEPIEVRVFIRRALRQYEIESDPQVCEK